MEVLPSSGVNYAGESDGTNQGSEKAFAYDGNGNTNVDNFVVDVEASEEERFGGGDWKLDESPTLIGHANGDQKLSSNTRDSGVDSLEDADTDERELARRNQECDSSHSIPEWLEQDQPMAVWVKWRGNWQAGIRCARSDWPLSTVRAKPTHDRKQYLVIFFPRKRNYSWADVLLVRPINESPEPIAYRSHNVGLKIVKDLTIARRFIMQKLAVSMINTIEQLHTEALIETARNIIAWKDFALEASKCKGYPDLGRMLLKLENMISRGYLNSYWIEHSLQSWTQRCQDAHSAESVEMLKEELGDAINWNQVHVISSPLISEWRILKPEVMKCFSMSNTSFNAGEVEPPQSNDGLPNVGLPVSRKRPKLEVRRAEVQPPQSRSGATEGSTRPLTTETEPNPRFFDGLTVDYPSGSTTDRWGEIVVETRNGKGIRFEATPVNKNKQCAAFIEAKGRRCVRWASDGDVYCCVHLAARFSASSAKTATPPPPPADAKMCDGTTVLGTKCKHRSLPGSPFCKKHRPNKGPETAFTSTDSPGNKLKRKIDEGFAEGSEANNCKEIVLSGHFETPFCRGDDGVRCDETPTKHSLYCEKHLPNWLKRARNGKSRIVSKEVFVDLLKTCRSPEEKLRLHKACELFYRFFKSVLSLRNPVPKEIQLQWVMSEASKDPKTGKFLMKLVCSEKERLVRIWGFNVNNIGQSSTPVEEPVELQSIVHPPGSTDSFETNVGSDDRARLQTYACGFCGSKFDLLPDLHRHLQLAHGGPDIPQRGVGVPFYANRLKPARLGRPKIKIQDWGAGTVTEPVEPQLPETADLARLAEPDCAAVANLLYSKIRKTKPRPGNHEILVRARSSCCRATFRETLKKKYGILPERLYLKAAKLCSERNVTVEWHRDGFVCPKGCRPVGDSLPLPPVAALVRGSAAETGPLGPGPVTTEWATDECHYVLDFGPPREEEGVERAVILFDDVSFGKESVPIVCVVDERVLGSVHGFGDDNTYSLPWESFAYVTKPVLDRSLDLGPQSLQYGCGCAHSTCSPKICDHVYLFDNDYEDAKDIYGKSMKRRFAYDDKGRIILEEGYLVYECNSTCSCNKDCQNRVLQNGVQVKLEVFKTEEKGWGVRAAEPIGRGTFVCEFLGEVIDEEEAKKRRQRYGRESCSYIYEIDARVNDMIRLTEVDLSYAIDATNYGNVSRYVNHSCSPNLENHQVVIDSLDPQMVHIGLYASRDIAVGEELTYDYMHKAKPGEGQKCHCGASNCRGRVH